MVGETPTWRARQLGKTPRLTGERTTMLTPALLAESVDRLTPSASVNDLMAAARAAQWAGFQVYHIEPDFHRCGDAESALDHIPNTGLRNAIWLGYIPTAERYAAIHAAARAKGLRLPNTLDQHRRAMEMDLAYPHLVDLTPATAFASTSEECRMAAEDLGFPLFLKGAVQSLKADGWKACVAETPEQLDGLCCKLFSQHSRSRGLIALRRLLDLRHKHVNGLGFPQGREYRIFCHEGAVLTLAYYWEGQDPFGPPTAADLRSIGVLIAQATQRLRTPYAAIDVGQDTQNRWWIIETADAQFAGLAPASVPGHWHRLHALLASPPEQ